MLVVVDQVDIVGVATVEVRWAAGIVAPMAEAPNHGTVYRIPVRVSTNMEGIAPGRVTRGSCGGTHTPPDRVLGARADAGRPSGDIVE